MAIKRMPVPQGLLAQNEPPLELAATQTQKRRQRHRGLNALDGTHQLLISGAGTMLVGLFAGLLTVFIFGGVGPQGARSNPGWLSLMVAMMSTPFALLLLLLGGAKWLRNYGLSKGPLQR